MVTLKENKDFATGLLPVHSPPSKDHKDDCRACQSCMKLHRGALLNNCPNCVMLGRVTEQAAQMYQSHVQSNEDGQRFVLRTWCKKIPVILSIFRSNSVQAWPLWWSYTNTYIGAPSEFLQWEEVNTTNKAAETLPTAQCIHNGFMSHFIWILVLFYVP